MCARKIGLIMAISRGPVTQRYVQGEKMAGENIFTRVAIGSLKNRVAIKSKHAGFYGYSSSPTLNLYKATNQKTRENTIAYLNYKHT